MSRESKGVSRVSVPDNRLVYDTNQADLEEFERQINETEMQFRIKQFEKYK